MYVLGTAGHVDHGKSTLIKALTGIDPDRLKEEKDRQMTIDLGFAWYRLPSGNEVGIVDVPGHRDFIDNMLAGIGGIDAVLFIIAADEGVMPQTREHFSILKLLKIQRGIIVLTKMDLVDDEDWIGLVEDDIKSLTRNTFLESAPIQKVSAISGHGLKELASSIDDMLVDCPPKKDIGKARLPIDRVFTLKGFGTIVTGTLIDGQFGLGQQVELLPAIKQARIRGIQSHKKKVETAYPGNRTALNLVGLDANEIRRGDVLANPGAYRATTRIDAKVDMLADASGRIKHNDHLKCFLGSAESIARIRVLGKNEIAPGDFGWVQMEFDAPIVPAKGDYFILRRPSPAETIAGGTVFEPHPARRYKRFSEKTLSRLALMDSGSQEELLISYLGAEPLISYKEFIKKHELSAEDMDRLIGTQIKLIGALQSRDALVSTFQYWNTLKTTFKRKLEAYYQKFPLRLGIPGNELNKLLKIEQKKFNLVIDEMVAESFLRYEDDIIALADHTIQFSEDDKKSAASIINEFERTPYMPPSLKDLSEEYDADLIDAMCGKGILVRIADDIAFTPVIYRKVIADTKDFLEKEGKITLAQFRDNLKTSRKYALALLEHMDTIGITLRKDDFRVLK